MDATPANVNDHWSARLPQAERHADLVRRIDADPNVVGLIVTGSYAHDTYTEHSDLDLTLVLAEPSEAWQSSDKGGLDLTVTDLVRFARIPSDPGQWFDRYVKSRVLVVLDRTEGDLDGILHRWGRLDDDEVQDAVDFYLDPYLLYTRRALKMHRAGRQQIARWDAVEGLPWTIRLLFALNGRVRPINAYLVWELTHYPIERPGWETERLLGLLESVLESGDEDSLRAIFALIEPELRRLGFGGALDGYGEDIDLLRSR